MSRPSSGSWRRIAVVGASGVGKTEMTRKLAASFDLPCTSLDDLRWPGEGRASDSEFARRLAESTAGSEWAIEGAEDSAIVRAQWERADLLVWLDHGRAAVVARMFLGTSWLNRFGPDCSTGRLAYARYLIRKAGRSRRQAARLRRTMPAVSQSLSDRGVTVIRLRSVLGTRRWLRSVRTDVHI
mgnify:CR=1 FL=1